MIPLFAAIKVPHEVAAQLSTMRGSLGNARWIEPEDYHITLRFAGVIDLHLAAELDHELAQIQRAPFMLAIQGLDQFGGDKPRSLFARVKPSDELSGLQAQVDRCAARAGIEAEKRKFVPHVTLARFNHVPNVAVAEFLSVRGYFEALEFRVDCFGLFSTNGLKGGGPYRLEREYAFAT